MNQKPNIAILILAAGNSSRMKAPKQLLPWKHTFLLNHAIENVVKLKLSKPIVILGANYDVIKTKLQRTDIEVVFNKHWKHGLGNSIAFGIEHIINNYSVNGVFIALADQPLIDTHYLNSLVNLFEVGKNQIIASNYGNEKLGVPALFDAFYFEELTQLNNDKGAKKVIENHRDNVLTLNAMHLIFDVDTIEDYERLYQKHH